MEEDLTHDEWASRAAAYIDDLSNTTRSVEDGPGDDARPAGFVWFPYSMPRAFGWYGLFDCDDMDVIVALPPDAPYLAVFENLACCATYEVPLPNGWTIHVGYHS